MAKQRRSAFGAMIVGASVIAAACTNGGVSGASANADDEAGASKPAKIEGWTHGEAFLMSWTGAEPLRVGSVGADGAVELDLPESVNTTQIMSRVFRCSDGANFTSTNPDVGYEITASSLLIGNPAEEQMFGYVVAATTEGAARARLAPGEAPAVQGSTFQWLYAEDAASFDGECVSDLYAEGDAPTKVTINYDMQLEPGWNILEHEVNDVMTTKDDRTYLTDHAYRTVEALPAGVMWVFAAEKQ